MNRPFDLVVFDVAGTTVRDRDHVATCLIDALAEVGVQATREQANAVMGIPKPLAIASLTAEAGHRIAIEPVFADFQRRMIDVYRSDPDLAPLPGAEAAFAQLREAGARVALDTGFSRSVLDVIMARLGWDTEVLDGSIASDEVAQGRPHPDMILALATRFGIADASRVAKVGDTPSDLRSGHAAGCGAVVAVLCGTHTRTQLEPYDPTHWADFPGDVPLCLGFM